MEREPQFINRLDHLCRKYGVPREMVEEMLDLEKRKASMMRRDNINRELEEILEKHAVQKQERLA